MSPGCRYEHESGVGGDGAGGGRGGAECGRGGAAPGQPGGGGPLPRPLPRPLQPSVRHRQQGLRQRVQAAAGRLSPGRQRER